MLLDDSLLLTAYQTYQIASGMKASSVYQAGITLRRASRWLINKRQATLGTATSLDLTAYMAARAAEVKGSKKGPSRFAHSGRGLSRLDTSPERAGRKKLSACHVWDLSLIYFSTLKPMVRLMTCRINPNQISADQVDQGR